MEECGHFIKIKQQSQLSCIVYLSMIQYIFSHAMVWKLKKNIHSWF